MTQAVETRLKSKIASLREQSEEGTRRALMGGAAALGGATAGYLQARYPILPFTGKYDPQDNLLPNTGIPTDAALGVAISFLGLLDMGGKYNDHLLAYGFGLTAGAATAAVRESLTYGADVYPRQAYMPKAA